MLSNKVFRIGTRDSKLALWQASLVKDLLSVQGIEATLVPVKSDGDLDLVTPLYAMGVQGVFTKTLDAFLLSDKIDIAVHSMKDVPTQLAAGIQQAAVLQRGNHSDLLVYKNVAIKDQFTVEGDAPAKSFRAVVATGSVRRKAQLLNRFPLLQIENLRGNVQTRIQKLQDNPWDAAIFAAAGLERIEERPHNSVTIDWMLPAPAQGAIMIACRTADEISFKACHKLNDATTALCVHTERDFLQTLMGGCSTPISALAEVKGDKLKFQGNILSLDGAQRFDIALEENVQDAAYLGRKAAQKILNQGAQKIVEEIRKFEQ